MPADEHLDSAQHPHRPVVVLLLLLLFLLLMLASVGTLWQQYQQGLERQYQRDFDMQLRHTGEMLQSHVEGYEDILRAARGLIIGSAWVSPDEWRNFFASLGSNEPRPGLHALSYIVPVAAGEQAAFEARMRSELQADFRIHPRSDGEQMVVLLTDRRLHGGHTGVTVGFDIGTDETVRRAAQQARARGRGIISRPQILHPEHHGMEVTELLPVYAGSPLDENGPDAQRTLRGWVAAHYDLPQLLDHAIRQSGLTALRIRVYDQEGGGELLFDSGELTDPGAMQAEVEMPIAGRQWRLSIDSSAAYDLEHRQQGASLLLLGGGVIVSLLLWFVARMLVMGRERALSLVEERTHALRQSEARYRELFRGNRAVQLLIAPDSGEIIDANLAAEQFYGYTREQLQTMRISQINTLTPDEVKAEMAAALREQRNHFNFRHRLADGTVRDVEVHSGPIHVGDQQLLYSIIHDISARRQAEAALRGSEAKYRQIVETTAEGYWMIDVASGGLLEVNDAICQMLAFSRSEMLGRRLQEFTDAQGVSRFLHTQGSGGKQRGYEVTLQHRDGHDVFVRINATDMRDEEGELRRVFAFITDVSDERRVKEKLRQASTFFDTTSEAITITDADNRIIAVNPAFTWITGYSEAEVLGKDPSLLSAGRQDKAFYAQMWDTLQRVGRWQGEIWNRRKSGEIYPEWLSIVVIKDDEGNVIQHLAIFSDITRRKRDEKKIWQQANFDALTGLPNRALFMDRLSQAMHVARREGNMAALLFIDLDRFKWVNDTLGHTVGDALLKDAAKRIGNCVRETDTVARLGGDEFTVILTEVDSPIVVESVAGKILQALARPFAIDEHESYISGSIGITLYPRDGQQVEELLRNADTAMYRSKEAGRNTFHYFTQAMNAEAKRRLRLEHDIRRALGRNELDIHYQPIVDNTGTLQGAEALLRWQHPELGAITPDEFVPLAEDTGSIIDIERWVLDTACRQVMHWSERLGRDLFVSVNISGLHCRNGECPNLLEKSACIDGLKPGQLKLEITERMMMENSSEVIALFEKLRRQGVGLAVDDFGTGYSSLSYLKRFPVDVLKIDRSFIGDLPGDKEDVTLVSAIIAMAHSLGLAVVAEGVENEAQAAFLREHGCEMLQGYHYSRPLDGAAFLGYLPGQE